MTHQCIKRFVLTVELKRVLLTYLHLTLMVILMLIYNGH